MRMHPTSRRPATPLLVVLSLVIVLLTACASNRGGSTTARYVLGAPYQMGGVWYYPQESYKSVQTGLAAIADDRHPAVTANGEAYDPTVLAAGHQTLQLPAIARVVNLENGLAVTLRINDRGPARPHRLLEFTPRAASLLGIAPRATVPARRSALKSWMQKAVRLSKVCQAHRSWRSQRPRVASSCAKAPAPSPAPTHPRSTRPYRSSACPKK